MTETSETHKQKELYKWQKHHTFPLYQWQTERYKWQKQHTLPLYQWQTDQYEWQKHHTLPLYQWQNGTNCRNITHYLSASDRKNGTNDRNVTHYQWQKHHTLPLYQWQKELYQWQIHQKHTNICFELNWNTEGKSTYWKYDSKAHFYELYKRTDICRINVLSCQVLKVF